MNRKETFSVIQHEQPHFEEPPKGDPTGICEVCGKRFQQHLNSRNNTYSQYRKCPKHKKAAAQQKKQDDEVVTVTLNYTPHPKQQLIHDSKARYKIINAGNRFGKDRATIMECIKYFIECLHEDRSTDLVPTVYWWVIAPIEKIANQFWRELKKYFPADFVIDLSNSDKVIYTMYGGVIEVRSAYNPEDLVGVGLDIVTITEAARIADLETVWANLEARVNSPGRGKGGKGGVAIINSSPIGQNYFYKLWTWGQKDHPDYDPDWESWTFTAFDNPATDARFSEVTVDAKGVALTRRERLKRRIGERMFNQNWLAEFTADGAKCFPHFKLRCVESLPPGTEKERDAFIRAWEQPEPYESYVVAYDPASINDIPAVEVFDSAGKMKKAYNMTGLGWNEQYDKLAVISKIYNYAPVAFSRTGHETIEEELQKRGLVCITFNEQGQNKTNFVNRLEGVCESGGMKVLDDGSEVNNAVIAQHADYARISHGKTITFGNVNENHDDFVSCSYIAFQAISTPDEALPAMGLLMGMRV